MQYLTIFPGQGAQKVGMGAAFQEHPVFQEHLAQADTLLNLPLSSLMAEGPAEQLKETLYAQLSLFVMETGIYKLWKTQAEVLPLAVAGHSLGEYSALYAAGVFSFEQGLELVHHRASWMQEDCEAHPGSMAAVIRPQLDAINKLCQSVENVVIANDNSQSQVVLSGDKASLADITARIQSEKWGKIIPLAVSGAFHSPLMQNASKKMAQHLKNTAFENPEVPVMMNSTAQLERTAQGIKAALIAQILSPVRWRESMENLAPLAPATVLEMGPPTLKRLVQQSLPDCPVHSIVTPEAMQARQV